MSMHNLGVTLLQLGRYVEGESWFRRAVHARTEIVAGYLYSKSFLADTVRELGRLDEAAAIYLATLAEQKERLAPDHPDTFRTTAALGKLRYLQGNMNTAEQLALQALEGQLLTEGEKSLDATETLNLLARIHLARGEFEKASAFADRAISIAADLLDQDHPVVVESRIEKVRILLAAGEAAAAHASIEGLYDALVAVLGARHPRSLETLALTIEVYEAAGDLENAERFRTLLPEPD